MTDFWREARDARSADPNRAPFAVAGEASDDGGFLYVPGQLLMTVQAVPHLPALTAPDFLDLTDRAPGLRALGVRWYEYSGPEPLLTLIESLELTARTAASLAGEDPDLCQVAPHHVVTGEPWIYRGGPGGSPRPAESWASGPLPAAVGGPHVAVLDTGIPVETPGGLMETVDVDRDVDRDTLWPDGEDGPVLAAEAGHGGFIAGIVRRMSNGHAGVAALKVLDPDGFGTEVMVLAGLERLRAAHPHIAVINLSLGAYSFRDRRPLALGAALGAWPSSTVVVAAAGNAGVAARPYWPAAQGAVVGVAALLRNGGQAERAEFSNSGPWVDISTDGVDILSVYAFGKFPDGPQAATTIDGWARWSGTSFAAPIVAAEIARLVVEDGLPPRRALATLMERLPSATDVSPALVGCGRLYDPRATVGIDPTSP